MNAQPCPVCGSPSTGGLDGICAGCLWEDCMAGGGDPVPGHILGEEIARGGMGIVYSARQISPDRAVAVKMLRPHLLEQPAMRERFRLEAQAAASLQHPGILPVYQVGETDGTPWFTMMLADGGTLASRRADFTGRWRETAALVARLAGAVGHAHERGVLHRDLKPANILFDQAGRAFIADFGLAKLAAAGGAAVDLTLSLQFLGTPHYVAPEIASGTAKTATTSADIYALGVILYELLAGRPPFEAESVPALLRMIADTEPAAITRLPGAAALPRDLAAITARCLEKNPASRYATSTALAEDLEAWLAGKPVTARSLTPAQRLGRWMRANPLVASLAALLAVALISAAILLTGSNRRLAGALGDARHHLHGALVREARMRLDIPTAGRRAGVLALLGRASTLGPVTSEMTELAAAAFSSADLTTVRHWEVPDGARVCFSPRLDWWIATGITETSVRVRSTEDGAELRRIPCPPGTVCQEAVWAEGADRVVLLFSDGSGGVWHMHQDEPLWRWPAGEAPSQISCSASCGKLALCRSGREVEIIDLPPREIRTEFVPGSAGSQFAVLSPDGRRVLTGSDGMISCLTLRGWRTDWSLRRPDTLRKCVWTSDGTGFAAIRNKAGALGLYDSRDGSLLDTFNSRRIFGEHLHLARNSLTGVSVSSDGLLRLWDQRDGEELLRTQAEPSAPRLSPDGSLLGWMPDRTHAAISRVGSPFLREHGARRRELPGKLGPFRMDETGTVLAASGKRCVVAWNAKADTPPAVTLLDLEEHERAVHLDCDTAGQRLLLGLSGGVAEFPVSAEVLQAAAAPNGNWQGTVRSLTGAGDFCGLTDRGNSWVFSKPDAVTVWTGGNPAQSRSLPLEAGAQFACFSPCGRWCAAVSADRDVLLVLRAQPGSPVPAIRLAAPGTQAVRFSPDGGWMLARVHAGWQLWNTADFRPGPEFRSASPLHAGAPACFSADGKLLLLRTEAEALSVFGLPDGTLRLRLPFPGGANIAGIQFHAASGLIWVLDENDRLHRWDLDGLEKEIRAAGYAIPAAPDTAD